MNKVGRLVPSSNKLILRDPQASLDFYYGATFGRRAWSQRGGLTAWISQSSAEFKNTTFSQKCGIFVV